jgi:hypothetical protein
VGSFHLKKIIIKKFNCSWFNYGHVINSGFQPDTFTAPIITQIVLMLVFFILKKKKIIYIYIYILVF